MWRVLVKAGGGTSSCLGNRQSEAGLVSWALRARVRCALEVYSSSASITYLALRPFVVVARASASDIMVMSSRGHGAVFRKRARGRGRVYAALWWQK